MKINEYGLKQPVHTVNYIFYSLYNEFLQESIRTDNAVILDAMVNDFLGFCSILSPKVTSSTIVFILKYEKTETKDCLWFVLMHHDKVRKQCFSTWTLTQKGAVYSSTPVVYFIFLLFYVLLIRYRFILNKIEKLIFIQSKVKKTN